MSGISLILLVLIPALVGLALVAVFLRTGRLPRAGRIALWALVCVAVLLVLLAALYVYAFLTANWGL